MIKLGIVGSAYLERYGDRDGLFRMREQGYEATDLQQFVDTETPFYRMPPAQSEKSFFPCARHVPTPIFGSHSYTIRGAIRLRTQPSRNVLQGLIK